MNYERIIGQSFKIALKKPSLWIFGMFAGGGALNFHLREETIQKLDFGGDPYQFLDFFMPLMGFWLVMIILSFVTSAISTTGLIESVNHLVRGGRYRFGTCFSRGVDLFWRMLALLLIEMFIIFVAIMAIALVATVSAATLILTAPAFFIFLFVWIGIMLLAKRTVVIRDIGAIEAIEEGSMLFRQNWQQCLAMAAFSIGIGFLFLLVGWVVALVIFTPINSLVESIFFDDFSILVAALVIGLPISFVLGGLGGTVQTNLGTMFYRALVEPGREHALDEMKYPTNGPPPGDSDPGGYGPV